MHAIPPTLSKSVSLLSVSSLLLAGSFLCGWSVPASAQSPRVVLTPAAGFTITWDGNNGGFFSAAIGAGPADNIALASHGTTAFGSGEYGSPHLIANANNGLYGNNNSWLPNLSDPNPPFIGLRFPASVDISSIAWGRDNGDAMSDACGSACGDRCEGLYTLQYTTVADPDATTAETDDDATGWANLGTVEYLAGANDIYFSAYLRHRFDLAQGGAPIAASGIRIKSPAGNAIDEIEVNPLPDPLFVEITPMPGYSVFWDGNEGRFSTPTSPAPVPANDASTNRGAVAFTSSDLGPAIGAPYHRAFNLNDGFYSNNKSWIPDFVNGDPAPFAGIKFGQPLVLSTIAWGRDNGDAAEGTFPDRALGLYTLQITTVPDPGVATPEACGPFPSLGWVTVATINYVADDPARFNSWLRHRFDLSRAGQPLVATGIRIKVPASTSDIDEIEVNAETALEGGRLVISSAPGMSITWDGNDGEFYNPALGAAPPANRALATEGTTTFASSELGVALGIGWHLALNLNDGLYGNNKSWISANGITEPHDPNQFAGLSFGSTVQVTNIAWGRDNGNIEADDCGGTCTDRWPDTYTLQYTTVAAPDATTAETGDAATGWAALGTITYAGYGTGFTPYLRHRFEVSSGGAPLEATGIRIKVSDGWTAIDEIEVNTAMAPPPALPPLSLNSAAGYTIAWDGNEAEFFNAGPAPLAPPNRASVSQGTVAFTSSDLGTVWPTNYHLPFNLNDGLYGNTNSWISANGLGGTTDPDPFAALNFNGTVLITNIAWGRDNGFTAEGGCGGTCMDRVLGVYTLQVTTVPVPDVTTLDTGDAATGWATVGTVAYNYGSPPQFTPYLRHRFDVSMAADGWPIEATGLRIKVSDGGIAIDEIEVNTLIGPQLSIARSGDQVIITWVGNGALEYATTVGGSWTCIPGAVSPYTVPVDSGPIRFYRVRR